MAKKSWVDELFNKSTRKALSFVIGAAISGFSVMAFKQYGAISIIGILVGVFFIIKALE